YQFALVTDITRRKQVEEQLLQAQKLESVGRLAGGVAHDFNNLLTTILGYSESIATEDGLDEATMEGVQEIRKSADRATALTQQLLAFSRKQIMQPKHVNLNELIESSEKMLTRLIQSNITFNTELSSALGLIMADPGQVEQVVMNLAINASDAMPGGGTLTIKTQNVCLDASDQREHPEIAPGAYVEIELSDTGHGMDEKTKSEIFEPFFTTKDVGRGTGLGLATVYGIVKQSDGHILVESEPKRGTTFRIYFPALEQGSVQEETSPTRQKAAGGNETILFVEDEESLRKMSKKMLESQGYTVIEATNGSEALAIMEQADRARPDCLVTDLSMPEMGGSELSKRLLQTFPSLKVLYISGYTEDSISHGGVLDEGIAFLQKPFTLHKLLTTIRAVLDAD
ncbi:MAG: response regulator, partial [Verrucomicrobia bacterium]|nr:response regulator [Verrucomicrobiota bacterium]